MPDYDIHYTGFSAHYAPQSMKDLPVDLRQQPEAANETTVLPEDDVLVGIDWLNAFVDHVPRGELISGSHNELTLHFENQGEDFLESAYIPSLEVVQHLGGSTQMTKGFDSVPSVDIPPGETSDVSITVEPPLVPGLAQVKFALFTDDDDRVLLTTANEDEVRSHEQLTTVSDRDQIRTIFQLNRDNNRPEKY
ncbi:hypothetical protein [Halobacterium noricense]|uniref:hypothetical protein n=1 Tax=Halobacterium noricense TaxID=223182 RepID=UPI001E51197F|nr:hypothetical protein [Halobacterium noricense]UHH24885.1 hypothetical protein LT974_12970 [Halobacterium noricense]